MRRACPLGLNMNIDLTLVIPCCSSLLDPSRQLPTSVCGCLLLLDADMGSLAACVQEGYDPV